MTELFKLDELVRAVVLHRPSKVSKTPYVADIHLVDENGNCQKNEDGENIIYQAHCPSLGCCGLCCLLYTSPSPRDRQKSRMPSSA